MGRPEGRLTPAQHEIMEVVWQAGEPGATVSEIWIAIASSRGPRSGARRPRPV